jgi:hypothetical protein
VLNNIHRTQRWRQGRFPAKASAGPIRGCDALRIGKVGQRLGDRTFRSVECGAWSRSTISWLRGGEGLRFIVYREFLTQRLGGWGIIIVVDEKRRPLLLCALGTAASEPEEEQECNDQETSHSSYDATCGEGPLGFCAIETVNICTYQQWRRRLF